MGRELLELAGMVLAVLATVTWVVGNGLFWSQLAGRSRLHEAFFFAGWVLTVVALPLLVVAVLEGHA